MLTQSLVNNSCEVSIQKYLPVSAKLPKVLGKYADLSEILMENEALFCIFFFFFY